MTSFLVRKASIFGRSFFSFSVSFSCCCSSSVTWLSSDWSSVWSEGLALERGAGEVLAVL